MPVLALGTIGGKGNPLFCSFLDDLPIIFRQRAATCLTPRNILRLCCGSCCAPRDFLNTTRSPAILWVQGCPSCQKITAQLLGILMTRIHELRSCNIAWQNVAVEYFLKP
jgi:hypothetical protein